jgi:hypothetical protein
MAICVECGEPTALFVAGVPLCLKCDSNDASSEILHRRIEELLKTRALPVKNPSADKNSSAK